MPLTRPLLRRIRRLSRRRALLAALLISAVISCGPIACGSDDETRTLVDRGFGFDPSITERIEPTFAPQKESFYRTPWPSDARLSDDGTIDVPYFPHSSNFPIDNYVDLLEEMTGFSTLPVIYVPLDRSIDDAWIPEPAETLTDASPIQLVDVTQKGCGDRIPVDINFDRKGGKFAHKHTLRIATAYGFPLRPDRTYALVVRRNFGNPGDAGTLANDNAQRALAGELASDAPNDLKDWADSLAPVRRCAETDDALAIDEIGIATAFTTQDPVTPLVRLQSAAADPDVSGTPSVSDWRRWEEYSTPPFREVFRATFEAPIFQKGDPPFPNEGGFGMLEGEDPQVRSRQTVPFNLTIPENSSPPHPLIIWQPGTGGDAESTLGQAHLDELVRRGFAIATFTPPFHGDRPGSRAPILNTFNYINGRAGRSNIRQQAAETTYFIRLLREAVDATSGRPDLDFEPLVYGGQSQGSVVGTLLAGVEPSIDVFAFNGVGGYFATSVLYRNDEFINVQETLRQTLGIDRPIDRYSLVVQMAQTIVDVGDPLNFARRWRGWREHPAGAHMFIVNGGQDQTFTQNAMNSLNIAAGIPPVGEPGWSFDPDGLVDTANAPLPVSGNRTARDDAPLTFGTRMVGNSGHFTIFQRPAARQLLVDYIDSTRDGLPPVIGASN